MSAGAVADACEAAIRERDVRLILPHLHPRVQATSFDGSTYTGAAELVTWARSVLEDPDTTVTVVERYIDEPVAVLVLLWATPEEPRGREYTAALITLDDTLVRVTLDG